MSFFIATCLYVVCNMVLHLNRVRSLVILSVVTLVIGGIYKYLEIVDHGMFHFNSLDQLLTVTGCYTSMSQNISGLLAAIWVPPAGAGAGLAPAAAGTGFGGAFRSTTYTSAPSFSTSSFLKRNCACSCIHPPQPSKPVK